METRQATFLGENMRIKSVRIQNYRSCLDDKVDLDDLTILVGANGAGKSTILRALDLFYSPSPVITSDDFFGRDTSREIVISVSYTALSDTALERFAKYVHNNELTVAMVVTWVNEKPNISFHGSHPQNVDFHAIYTAASKTKARELYDDLRKQGKYSTLAVARSYEAVLENLQRWEKDHPADLKMLQDDGQFFGFKQVGRGYLFDYSQFLLVSAVRDASEDSEEGRGSVVTRLMDLVVRSVLANRDELVEFRRNAQMLYEAIMRPDNLPELGTLRDGLTTTLQTLVPNSRIELDWQRLDQLDVPMPKASVSLMEDGYLTKVEHTGHGLQRAFIFTMLQHLAVAQRQPPVVQDLNKDQDTAEAESPSLVIAIEEPELYQHPNRQRHFGRVLRRLARGEISGVAANIQILCATHSPLFIDINQFDEVRLVRKVKSAKEELPKATKVYRAACVDIVTELKKVMNDAYFSVQKLRTLMPQLMTVFINEGFFADVVVLVEGETDRTVLLEIACLKGYDLEGMGIGIIPTGGKGNLVIPAVIFRRLGIPVYLIWDCDRKADNDDLFSFVGYQPTSEKGKKLQRLNADVVNPHFCAFYKDREHTMEVDVGKMLFSAALQHCSHELGSDSLKKPVVARRFVRYIYDQGQSLATIERIIEYVVAIRQALLREHV